MHSKIAWCNLSMAHKHNWQSNRLIQLGKVFTNILPVIALQGYFYNMFCIIRGFTVTRSFGRQGLMRFRYIIVLRHKYFLAVANNAVMFSFW